MNSKLLSLALVLGGGWFCLSQTAHVGETAADGRYDAYWLSDKTLGAYEKIVLTRKPLAKLRGLTPSTNQPIQDCDAIVATTYGHDSIWNVDMMPFKALTGVETVGTNSIVINGEQFAYTPANLEDVLRLLRNPMGKIPIHRIYGPLAGQEEPVRMLASRLERQLKLTPADGSKETLGSNEVQFPILSPDVLQRLRHDLKKGTPEQKERALKTIVELKAVTLVPDVMEAIEDPTPLPQHEDTGWGFVGHEAATVMARIAQSMDGLDLKERGYRAYSFWDDSGDGGEKLKAAGRLAEVRRNWEKWWRDRPKNQ
jgi:hypothetical protein